MAPQRHIPHAATCVRHKASGAIAYLYTLGGRPCVMAYAPRAKRATFHERYSTEEQRARRVTDWFSVLTDNAKAQAERKARDSRPHQLQAGHVLVCSWGYEQTNVDFYQVTRVVSANMVEIRKIASTTTKETGWAQGQSVPLLDNFTGEAMRKRVRDGDRVTITDYASARLWDGTPQNWTAYA